MRFPVYYSTESAWSIPPRLPDTIYSLSHSEHPLTTYLRRRWQEQKAQNRRHSKKPHVETNAQSERNINSDLPSTVAPTKEYHLARRGDRNVPLRYIKGAEWVERKEDQDLSPGYYALNDDSDLIPIEFDFEAIQWGIAEATPEGTIRVRRPAPIELGLRIFDEERVERSQWGPRDGTVLPEETPAPQFRFGSDNRDTPDPDLQIPTTEKSE